MTKTSTSGTPAPSRRAYTYWVTRDSDFRGGRPHERVKVWVAKPHRERVGAGAKWLTDGDDDLYCEWTLGECYAFTKTCPDDDRMCIRVEGCKVRGPDDPLYRPNVS